MLSGSGSTSRARTRACRTQRGDNVKRLKRFSEADNRHIRGCAYCQSKLLKNAVRTFNESERKQGSQMRADEDAVFAAPLPEKAPHSASERMRACSACETRT